MKTKLILGALLCATICGSAFAISVDDRQAFCNQYPDKYVWVEKTQACVPVDPCDSTIQDIKDAYCVRAAFAAGPEHMENYIETVLGTSARWGKVLADGKHAYYTTDGLYLVFNNIPDPKNNNIMWSEVQQQIEVACWVNGYDVNAEVMLKQKPLLEDCSQDCAKKFDETLVCDIPDVKPSKSKAGSCSDVAQYASNISGLEFRPFNNENSAHCVIVTKEIAEGNGCICDNLVKGW